jgi:hypothetical protein
MDGAEGDLDDQLPNHGRRLHDLDRMVAGKGSYGICINHKFVLERGESLRVRSDQYRFEDRLRPASLQGVMAVYRVEKGTPGILVTPKGQRRNFTTKCRLDFPEASTSGPFEGLYVFERGEVVIYVAPEQVSILPDSDLPTDTN